MLKDAKTATGKGKIEQYGTGALTVESSVTLGDGADSGTFTLGGSSATSATFVGTLADGISVAKTGNGSWTFNPQGDLTNDVSVAGGTLAVSGGTFETKKNLIVGRDGTGAIELSGSGVVKAVDVTVGHTDGQSASSLSFTSDENGGLGSLVADSLDFAEGTKLTVDVAACPTAKKAKLITLANAATGRDNVTLELINADKEAMLFWSADGKTLSYRLPRGGVVILR